jgi:hypothetical protein
VLADGAVGESGKESEATDRYSIEEEEEERGEVVVVD